MSAVEKKWWFVAPVALLATFLDLYLLQSAGMPPMGEFSFAQWIVHTLCLGAIWRCLSFMGWLLVLGVAPALADPKLRKPA